MFCHRCQRQMWKRHMVSRGKTLRIPKDYGYSEGHRKIVVVSSSMLRLWMVDWSMRKFTYTIDQDSMHKRYEHHISTTTIILELSIIVNQVVTNCLKQSPVIFNYFCSKQSAAYFCLTETPPLYLIYNIAGERMCLH